MRKRGLHARTQSGRGKSSDKFRIIDNLEAEQGFNTYRQKIGKQAQGNTELEIEYEKILNRVKTRSSRPAAPKTPHTRAPDRSRTSTIGPHLFT